MQYAVQSDANARIEEAKKGAAEAHATAKQLDSDLAAEKGKVAGLQKDAANAKAAQQRVEIELSKQKELTARVELALENERAKLAPRRITASQEDVLVSELKGKVEKLFLVGRDEQEPRQYADQFISALRASDLLDTYVLTNSATEQCAGIRLFIPLPTTATNEQAQNDPLVKAFERAGIAISGVSWGTTSGVVADPRLNRNQRTIYIGEKPLAN
ncbi:MAG: hypothetical protein WB630_14105 [Candidatus Acidiferrales bacterium]